MDECMHCRSALPALARERGFAFCCNGCESVHAFLQVHALGGYYDRLKVLGASAPKGKITPLEHSTDPFDSPDVQDRLRFPDGTFRLHVPSLHCAACLWLVETSLRGIEGVREARVDLLDRRVVLTFAIIEAKAHGNIGGNGKEKVDENALPRVVAHLRALGYEPFPPSSTSFVTDSTERKIWQRERLRDTGIAGVLFLNAMMLAAALYIGEAQGISNSTASALRWISLGVTVPSLLVPGRMFFRNAWKAASAGRLHYDFPISAALALAFVVSAHSTFIGAGGVYFDSITGLVFLLGAGRSFNESLMRRARRLTNGNDGFLPAGSAHAVVGDTLRVPPGQAFPADGRVTEGVTDTVEAMLTGESLPVRKVTGDRVFAGTVNITGPVSFCVEQVREGTFAARLQRAASEAFGSRSRFELLADKALRPFVLMVLTTAVVGAAYWAWNDPARVVPITLSLFIVGCPCALALAAPLATAVALQRAWSAGFGVTTADVFERLQSVDTIVFDKTGTLTRGTPTAVMMLELRAEKDFLREVSLLAATSRHPFSRAIAKTFAKTFEPVPEAKAPFVSVEELPGCGLCAKTHNGRTLWLGSPHGAALRTTLPKDVESAMASLVQREETRSVVVATDGTAAVVFFLEDCLRPEVPALVSALCGRGLRLEILSGDSPWAVARCSREAGIPQANVRALMMPEDKRAHIEKLQNAGARVLMIGDGINDASAMATAHVGVAMDDGSDIARACALIHLRGRGLAALPWLLKFAVRTKGTMILVLCTSAAYNVTAMALSLSGHVHPLTAALIMPVSSLTAMAIALWRNGGPTWSRS